MTLLFWILCIGMAALALAFVLPPLVRSRATTYASTPSVNPSNADAKKQKALTQAREAGILSDAEYRQKLAALSSAPIAVSPSWTLPVVMAVLLPFAAFALYHHLGEPRALDPTLRAVSSAGAERLTLPGQAPAPQNSAEDNAAAPNMDQAVSSLAERMRTTPDDLEGWMLLGRAYKTMDRFALSRDAFSNAMRLAPDDADVMVEYAEAQVLASDEKRIGGEPLLLLERALVINPNQQRGMFLMGISHMQAGVPSEAVAVWERLLPLLDGAARESVLSQIDRARELAGMPPRAPDGPIVGVANAVAPPDAPNAAQGTLQNDTAATGGLIVEVDIDPALKSKIGASDVLFVYARAAEGPRMPLAIQRLSAGDLPVRVVLDDSTSMMPTMKLSLIPSVVVGARISKSGQATPQPGDFEAVSAPMANTSDDPVQLRIDRVVQ